MDKAEAREKASLLKEALKIVDKLADFEVDDFDSDEIDDLISRAQTLRKSRWWDVPKR